MGKEFEQPFLQKKYHLQYHFKSSLELFILKKNNVNFQSEILKLDSATQRLLLTAPSPH